MPASDKDEKLIDLCLLRDYRAWDKFVKKNRVLVIKAIRYKCKTVNIRIDRSEIEDLTQDIFLDIWEKDKLRMINKKESLNSWLVITAINAVINYCRKRYFRDNTPVSLDTNLEGESMHDFIMDNAVSADISKKVENRENIAGLNRLIENFSVKQRLAFKLYFFHGKKHREISEIMRVPRCTVATYIKRSKEYFADNDKFFNYI